MDRTQEKVQSLPPKVHALESTANIHPKLHEKPNGRGSQRTFSPESSTEIKPHGRSINTDGFLGRKPELVPQIQAQYYHSPGVMGLPYFGMNMDPRNSANLYYTYNSPVMGYHGMPGGYGQGQRPANGEELGRDARTAYSAQAERTERSEPSRDREPKEPIRTESVIKIASERSDPRKAEPSDKRHPNTSDEHPSRFTDRNGDVDRHATSYRGSRDAAEARMASNGDAKKGVPKPYDGSPTDAGAYGSHRMSQNPASYANSSSSHSSSVEYTYSEQKTDPRVASKNSRLISEYPRSVSENSRTASETIRTMSDPSRVVTSSGIFSSMPKLTPIAPRGPLAPYPPGAPEIDHRSPIAPPWRAPYLTYAGPRPDFPTSTAETALQRGPFEHVAAEESRDARLQRPNYGARAFDKEDAIAARENYARASYYPWVDRMGDMSGYYQTPHGYTRPSPSTIKRPEKDEKDSEDVRQRSGEDSRGTTSPERTTSKQVKEPAANHDNFAKKEKEPEKLSVAYKEQDSLGKNQIQYNKNEKPVLPDNVRYKVGEEKKGALKSDKVTVYPKQGQAYVVSVRESSQKVSDYFSNGRTMSAEVPHKERAPMGSSEPTSKRDAAYRMNALMENSKKPEVHQEPGSRDTGSRDAGSDASFSEYHRRLSEELKKNNDKNNNAPYEMYSYSSYHNDRTRNPNRITLSQDKVFVPPNATLEMFEKREQEMERVRAACSRDAARNTRDHDSRAKQEEATKPRPSAAAAVVDVKPVNKPTPYVASNTKPDRRTEAQDSSDDDDLKVIEEKTSSGSDGTGSHGSGSQNRHPRADERRAPSPSYATSRQRITSPPSERSSTHSSPYAPYAGSFPGRRPDADLAAREGMERNFHNSMGFQSAAGLYGAGMQYQQFAHVLGGMQLQDPYSMYRGGQSLHQDPVTGSIMMVPDAAYLALFNPMVAAESQLAMDPSLARFYAMQQQQQQQQGQGHMDDPRWQQFYQMMQTPAQQKHLHEHAQQQLQEKYKHDMMMAAQQGAWASFYQKQMEVHRKEERERREAADQRPKSREEQQNRQTNEKPETKVKEETPTQEDRKQVRRQSQESDSKGEQTKRAQESAATNSSTGAPETQDESGRDRTRTEEAQNDKIKEYQFQQYLLQGGFSNTRFPFPVVPTPSSQDSSKSPLEIMRDASRNSREVPRDLSRTGDNYRAAVALAHMDKEVRNQAGQRSDAADSNSARVTVEQRVGPQVGSISDDKSSPQDINLPGKPWSAERSAFSQRDANLPVFSPAKTISAGVPSASHTNIYDNNKPNPGEKGTGKPVPQAVSTVSDIPRDTSEVGGNNRTAHVDQGHAPLLVAEVEKLRQDDELEVVRVGSGKEVTQTSLPIVNNMESRLPNGQSERSHDMELLISLSNRQQPDPLESPSNKSEIFWMEDSEAEDDFEIRTINSSFRPLKREFDLHDKENSLKFSLTNTKSEEEKKKIRENIERLRVIAKSRTREERFTVFSRNNELRSPTSIVNNVTASINEMMEMNVLEKDIRLRLADLQKRYREKHRELARLQPRSKDGNEDGTGKNTPIKRGPGRPRKRKYFGASTRSGKTTPAMNSNGSTDITSRSERSTPISCPQSPSMRSVTSEDNLVTRDSVEPPRKKKRRRKIHNESEKIDKVSSESLDKDSEGDSVLLPSPPRIVSRKEIEEMNRKKSSKKSPKDEVIKPVKAKRSAVVSPVKEKMISPVPLTQDLFVTPMARLISAISPAGFDDALNVDTNSMASTQPLPSTDKKPKKVKKVKKSKKSKVIDGAVDNAEGNDKSPEIAKTPSDSPKSGKPKKIKTSKKKKKSSTDTTPVPQFDFPDVESTNENININVPKQLVSMETKEAMDGSHDDDVFREYQGVDALDMLADFASSAEKRKGPDVSAVTGHAQERVKRKVKPKKPFMASFELDDAPAPKKKKKKKKSSTGEEKSPKKKTTPPPPDSAPVKTEPAPTIKEAPKETTKPENEPLPMEVKQEKEEFMEVVEDCEETMVTEALATETLETNDLTTDALATDALSTDALVTEDLVTPEPAKERRRKSRAGSLKDDMSPFLLFGDWQPRRSERIFINSSVPNTPNVDSSPLSSPTAKTGEFGWPKKTKKISKPKKSSKSSSDIEIGEEEIESPTDLEKPVIKLKKKSPSKSKKRRSSSVTDPDFVMRTPKRKAAKREKSYGEADDEEDDDEEDARYEDDADNEDYEFDVDPVIEEEEEEEEEDDDEPEEETAENMEESKLEEKVENTFAEGSVGSGEVTKREKKPKEEEWKNIPAAAATEASFVSGEVIKREKKAKVEGKNIHATAASEGSVVSGEVIKREKKLKVEGKNSPAEGNGVSSEVTKREKKLKVQDFNDEEQPRKEKKRKRKSKKEDAPEKEKKKDVSMEEAENMENVNVTEDTVTRKAEEEEEVEVEIKAEDPVIREEARKVGKVSAPAAESSSNEVSESEVQVEEDEEVTDEKTETEEDENKAEDEVPKEPEENKAVEIAEEELKKSIKDETPKDPPFTFTKDELLMNTEMLVAVDRVFFRGHIILFQEPDLYGIVLNGERGRRPHLRSTDQLLTQAVKDIQPSMASLPIGTRVCAHWSPQYRCYYPGNVIEAPPDEKEQSGKVWIEFDDGDSGIFPLDEIRRITTQFAMEVEDVESDVLLSDIRSRSSSLTNINVSSPSKKKEDASKIKEEAPSSKGKDDDVSDTESADNVPVRRSKGRAKRRGRLSTRERRLSEATDSDGPRENRESDFDDANVSKKERSKSSKTSTEKDYKEESKPHKRERKGRLKEEVLDEKEKHDRTENTPNNSTDSLSKLSKLTRTSNENVIKQEDEDAEPSVEGDNDNDIPLATANPRPRGRPSRSNSELDLRKKSLTLSLTTTRASSVGAESPRQESHDEDSGSCSDAFDESPQTESRVFQPRLGKRRRSELDRLRQDLKSTGQLWQWSGKSTQNKRKGKGRKVFYKNITRGDETISVGDCAVFTSNPSKSNNLPYVGKVESMWETWNGAMVVRVRWFYHPEETKPGRRAGDIKNSLYRSTHVDENEIQTISHKCDVVPPDEYKCRMQSQDTMATRSSTNERFERLFCCTGSYDPSTEKIES